LAGGSGRVAQPKPCLHRRDLLSARSLTLSMIFSIRSSSCSPMRQILHGSAKMPPKERCLSAADSTNEDARIAKEIDMIQVRRTAEHDSFIFEVVVREGKGETRHHVTMSRETCERLTAGKHTPERCLEAAFRFLLDREPKESILRRFDVTAISRYFPEFEREIPRALAGAPSHFSPFASFISARPFSKCSVARLARRSIAAGRQSLRLGSSPNR